MEHCSKFKLSLGLKTQQQLQGEEEALMKTQAKQQIHHMYGNTHRHSEFEIPGHIFYSLKFQNIFSNLNM